jgi:serine phosphatase RsbU (regulator of sigma subunit)
MVAYTRGAPHGDAVSAWIESHAVAEPERGGDFATCFDLAGDRKAVVVGDIAGHRTAAGDAHVLCGVVSSLVTRDVPLSTILRRASRLFTHSFETEATPFASLFLAVADLREGRLEYASAGHEPALLFSGGGTAHDHLPATGPLLGVEDRPLFRRRVVPLVRDSVLVVVTDGITEARRTAGDHLSFFGSAGVSRTLCEALRAACDPADAIYRAALAYAGGTLTDDASVVVSALPAPRTLA